MKNKTTFIYTLSTKEEPNNIRYIGKTDNPKDRIERHIQPYYLNEGTYKANWLKSELNKVNTPILTVIDEVYFAEWQFWESYWIEQFRAWGFKLTNGTTGGEGLILTKDLINKRTKTRMDNTALKIIDKIKFYNIQKNNNLWYGERVCNNCNKIVIYKKEKRFDLIKELKRVNEENRICEECHLKRKKKQIIQLDNNGNKLNVFESIRYAEMKTGIDRASISRCCQNKQNTAGGFKWKFK